MYLLDTDHIALIDRGGAEEQRIATRIQNAPPEQVAVSIISYEEQMRGWLAYIAQQRSVDRQMTGYMQLIQMLHFYCATPLLPFTDQALAEFQGLWLMRLKVGTMDLKIASIALANRTILLTRNQRDFGKIPGLVTEDWSV